MAQKIPWTRILAEGLVIVVSILLAFGIDAWWNERQERQQEAEYLSAILDEVDGNIEALPGNRSVWDRSYSDLLRTRALLRAGLHVDSAAVFLMSINRGLMYGVPSISTAVFDDLSNSGRMVVIKDFAARRRITSLYAGIEAEVTRFARVQEPALVNLVSRHTPPGLLLPVGPQFTFNAEAVSAEELRSAVQILGSEQSLPGALNAELRRRENEKAFLDRHEESLKAARNDLMQIRPSGSRF